MADLNRDLLDLLEAFDELEVRFLVVGAHALGVHGVPRATGDLHLWIRPDSENGTKAWQALDRFGAPVRAHGLRMHLIDPADGRVGHAELVLTEMGRPAGAPVPAFLASLHGTSSAPCRHRTPKGVGHRLAGGPSHSNEVLDRHGPAGSRIEGELAA